MEKKKSHCYQRNLQAERDGIFNANPIAVELSMESRESSDCIGVFRKSS